MKKSVNSNIYGYALDSTWEAFGGFLSGAHETVVCIVGTQSVSNRARDAFEKSFDKLGYGQDACTFVTLSFPSPPMESQREEDAQGGSCQGRGSSRPPLPCHPLADDVLGVAFAIIEGLDPLVVVAADAQAAEMLGKAYRTGFDRTHSARLLGRTAVSFTSFEDMLDSSDTKQKAWAVLKRLAR